MLKHDQISDVWFAKYCLKMSGLQKLIQFLRTFPKQESKSKTQKHNKNNSIKMWILQGPGPNYQSRAQNLLLSRKPSKRPKSEHVRISDRSPLSRSKNVQTSKTV